MGDDETRSAENEAGLLNDKIDLERKVDLAMLPEGTIHVRRDLVSRK